MLLARYILRSHIGPFIFGTCTIMALFLLQYVMNWLDKLAGKNLDAFTIIQFMVLNLSWILVLAVPIGVLFSTLMAFGAMSAAYEVTIMKASGMGLIKMMVPVLICGCLLWGFTFWYTDSVLPDTNLRLSTMMRDITRTKPTFSVDAGQFTTHVEGYTILARKVDSLGVMEGVTIYDRSKPEKTTIVSADTGRMAFSPSLTKLVLQLTNGEIHQGNKRNPNDYRTIRFEKHQLTMFADRFFYEQSDVTGSSRSDREMRIADMRDMVRRANNELSSAQHIYDSTLDDHLKNITSGTSAFRGIAPDTKEAKLRAQQQALQARAALETQVYRIDSEQKVVNRYSVEIYKKYAIPAACFVFVFVGCPLGIITKGGNFGISAAISLGFYILYWISLIGGEELADRSLLSPALAMWAGNALIGAIGIVLMFKVNYDR